MTRYLLTLFLVMAAACCCHVVRCQEGEAETVDMLQLAKQWEEYARGLSDLLTREQKKSLESEARVSELVAQTTDLQSKYETAESAAQEKAAALKEMEAKLDAAKKGEKAALEANAKAPDTCPARLALAESSLKYAKAALLEAEEKVKNLASHPRTAAFLPPHLAERWMAIETVAVHHWSLHGRPALLTIQKKTSTGLSHLKGLLDPHLARAHTGAMQARVRAEEVWREQYKIYAPHCERVWKETTARVAPHTKRVQAVAVEFWETGVERASPRVKQVRQAAEEYHAQLEGVVRGLVETHGRGWKPEAEVVQYLAAALFALPLLLLALVFIPSGIQFGKKATRAANVKSTKHKSHQRRSHRD